MIKNLVFILIIVYLIYLIYPFYQRYWASITYGESGQGKHFVNNIETIAYGLTFNDAEKLATELKKPAAERKAPDILDFRQYTGGIDINNLK